MRIRSAVVCGVALVALAGCSPTEDGAEAGKVAPPVGAPVTAGPAETFRQRPGVAAFVAAFRTTFPDLADGRSDEAIADEAIASDVTHVCLDDLRDPTTSRPPVLLTAVDP